MLSKMERPARTALLAAVVALLAAAPARAQSGRCGQARARSRQNVLQTQSPVQQSALQTQVPTLPYGFQGQFPPQDPMLVALQQQNAQLIALQQQNALLTAQLRQLQNGQTPTPLPPSAPPSGQASQVRPAQAARGPEPADQPADPEAAATRKLQAARDLLSDASRAEFEGEQDRADRMRRRAAERLRDLVRQYAGTRAADKAQQLLAKLDA
jgi:hypothetical protein